jgi:uncharacterized protein (DUF302 family)
MVRIPENWTALKMAYFKTFVISMIFLLAGCDKPQKSAAPPAEPAVAASAARNDGNASMLMKHYSVAGKFDDVLEYIKLSISEKGIKINTIAHIAEMLDRTGKDVGATKQVYLHGQAVEFCSATVSRTMMEADPQQIIFCPYIIYIYVLPDDPETVHVAYRLLPVLEDKAANDSLRAVEKLLDDIISSAVQ